MRGICCVFVCVRERESVDIRESVLEVALRKWDLLVEKKSQSVSNRIDKLG